MIRYGHYYPDRLASAMPDGTLSNGTLSIFYNGDEDEFGYVTYPHSEALPIPVFYWFGYKKLPSPN